MQGRMHFFTDLFAADAKYHKSCYAQYISKKNILANSKKPTSPQKLNNLEEKRYAFKKN